jgi:hypothetical protein
MAADPQNPQYSSPGPLFAAQADYASTGSPGSAGIVDSPQGTGGGGVIGSAPVTMPYQSVQGGPPPATSVTAGDTAGMADDLGAHTSPITPGPLADYLSTGPRPDHTIAGQSHANAGH